MEKIIDMNEICYGRIYSSLLLVFSVFSLFLISFVIQPALAVSSDNYGANANTKSVVTTPPILSKHVKINNMSTTNIVSNKNTCPCIVFRLDDVQASYLSNIQMKIMDVFQKKNASLSIGIIGYNLTKDEKLVSYLKNDLKPGHAVIDMTNNGWKHENFATLGLSQQITVMNKTNQELNKMFGKKPNVFVVPYGMYDDDYYVIDVKINNHLIFSSDHVTLYPGSDGKIKLVAPWPSMMENLITVKVYNQTKVLPSDGQVYAVELYDDHGNKLSKSPVNIHGEGYFWSVQVGDYVFKVVKASNDTVLGDMFVTVDGTKNNFNMTIQNHTSAAKPVLS